ncbi:MAG: BREX-1 system phosphatase PglZ type A [Methanobrevibacter sp.]|nr:BREX-1 system phosphatase PglZ type A [Methanobrevibacter sp.]
MNLQKIQSKLLELFSTEERQIVFWYDDKAQFQEDIANLELNDIKKHILTDSNWIHTKYLLEVEDKDSDYLIYAPFSKPDDRDNNLADTVYYSKEFFADKISFLMEELNIPNKFKSSFEKYSKFFNSQKRIDSFKDFNIENYTDENIIIAILSVLCNLNIPNFDEVLKELLTEENLKENKLIENFEKMNILKDFWDLAKKKYSYIEKKPNLEKFFISLVLTHASTQFDGNIPKAWEKHILENKNNIKVFMSNLMSNSNYKIKNHTYQEMYDINAKKVEILFKNSLSRIPVDSYKNCDTFEIFDINIMEYIAELLVSNQEYNPHFKELIENRIKTHFYKNFLNEYHVLKWANFLIKNINLFTKESRPNSPDEIIAKYSKEWFLIDKAYRKFYFYYAKVNDNFKDLRDLIEKMYSNNFLYDLAIHWAENYNPDKNYIYQTDFYKKVVSPRVSQHRTVVIISDALRYECGDELKDILNQDELREIDLSPIISTIPSNTEFGMAALLPHNDLSFHDNLLIDNNSTRGLDNRQKILNNYSREALAVNYETLMDMHHEELRTFFKDYQLIYVYHNQIDARGDHLPSQNEVFIASDEAIKEIEKLIKRLTSYTGTSNFIVTADHGFIYRNDSLKESDKIDIKDGEIFSKNKRFLLSNNELNINGTFSHKIPYLNNDLFVTVPKGMDIFKTQGGGLNYVHGGASLQEIIIPLLKVRVKSTKRESSQVKLNLIAPINRRITNLETHLTFAQSDKISDKVLPLQALIYIEDEYQNKISNEIIIHANKTDDDPKLLEFREKITVRNKQYDKSKNYYLVIEDEDKNTEIDRYEFVIDLAFADEFDF